MIIVFNLFVSLVCVTHASTENDTENALDTLEKQKYDLLLKIQEAIEDSAKVLQKTNDPDSMAGLKHLEELKKHFNKTAMEDEKYATESRRSEQPRYLQKGEVKLDLFDIASIFGKKHTVQKEVRQKNQQLMREKLREWIKLKDLERKKIQAYKEKMNIISERCPNNGLGSRKTKKKKKTRRAYAENKKKVQSRKKFPCCRKCCKRSYLGCL